MGENPLNFEITPEIERVFQLGLFYLCGRDEHQRPILVVKPSKIKDHAVDDSLFRRALIVFSQIIRQHCFRLYHPENWVMIIDLDKRSITDFPFRQLKMLITTTSLFFAGCLHKMYLLNPSGFFLFTFKIVERVMDAETRPKLQALKLATFVENFEKNGLSPNEIPVEFGGLKRDEGCYWPPVLMNVPRSESPFNIFQVQNSALLEQESVIRESKSEPVVFPRRPSQVISERENLRIGEPGPKEPEENSQGPITVVDFDVFLESNNLSSQSFYGKSNRREEPRTKSKFLTFDEGIILREKAPSRSSFVKASPDPSLLTREPLLGQNVFSFKNMNPKSPNPPHSNFPQIKFPGKHAQAPPRKVGGSHEISSHLSFPRSFTGDPSTDYSYSYYAKRKNQSMEELIRQIRNSHSFGTKQVSKKIVRNSVLLEHQMEAGEGFGGTTNLKRREQGKIGKKAKFGQLDLEMEEMHSIESVSRTRKPFWAKQII